MKRILLPAAVLAALLGCGHSASQTQAADASAVLANVNGTRITQAMLEANARMLASDPQQAAAFLTDPAAAPQRAQMVHQMAFQAAMDQIGATEKLDQDPLVQAKLAQAKAAIYAQVLIARAAGDATPTEAQLKAFYDEQVAARKAAGQDKGMPPYEQVKAVLPRYWQQDQLRKAQDAFQKDLKTRVPVTYADGLQAPDADF